MRHLFPTLLLFISIAASAQTDSLLNAWAQRLGAFGQALPQEEVFVHMDNTCYFLGDTIYYKAYLRRSDTGRPSNLSGLLYVELLNHDGYLVERKKLKMTDGQGHGTFCLPDTAYSGYYELRAYTRWQLNWGQTEHAHTREAERWFYSKQMAKQYYRDYDKLYSRVFPVYDKPKTPGEYVDDMTLRPLRRTVKTRQEAPEAHVALYPEGGNIVEGTTCRIAFEANDAKDGHHLKGTLRITASDGSLIAEAPTEHRGRGTIEVAAPRLHDAAITFVWGDGYTQQVKAPKATPDGTSIKVQQTDTHLTLELRNAGRAATDSLGLTIMHHGTLRHFASLGQGTDISVTVPLDSLPTGVNQLTVFNGQGRVWADRLVFVRHADLQPSTITIEGIKDGGYAPLEQIAISLSGLPSQTVSVAVRDANHSASVYDSGNILTEMLLASQIKGFVEHPQYYFEADDAQHRRHLDLLLMTQGWRRYDWVEMATPKAFYLEHTPERTQVFTGQVCKYSSQQQEDLFAADNMVSLSEGEQEVANDEAELASKMSMDQTLLTGDELQSGRLRHDGTVSSGRFHQREGTLKREVTIHAEFVQNYTDSRDSDYAVGNMMTYNKGLFKIEAPAFYNDIYFFLGATDQVGAEEGDQLVWVGRDIDRKDRLQYPEYYVKINPIYPRFVKPYSYYQAHTAPKVLGGATTKIDDEAVTLREVTIESSRTRMGAFNAKYPAFVVDAYKAFNDVCDAGLCPGYFIGSERFAYDVARTYIGDMNMERNYELERRYNSKPSDHNMSEAMRNSYNLLKKLDKVAVYTDYSPRREGDKKFSQDNQPLVTVDIHRYSDSTERLTYQNRRYILSGYAVCSDFYHPDYSQTPLPDFKDYRRTLYWNPSITLDAEGHADIRLYNNSQTTPITVSAQGLGHQGELLTGEK